MKLLSTPISPFAARVRLAIYAKSLPVEIATANTKLPNGEKSPEFLAINPMGRVPALILDDGTAIPESDSIVEFLADAFPAVGLRPELPSDIARGRLLARIMELYVVAPGTTLFDQIDPQVRRHEVVQAGVARMNEGLSYLDRFMTDRRFAVGDALTTADCALVPFLYFFPVVFGLGLEQGSLVENHPRVLAYWQRMQSQPVVLKILAEISEGISKSPLKIFKRPEVARPKSEATTGAG